MARQTTCSTYPQTPENKAFVEEYRKVYKKVPTMPAFYGYTAARFLAKAYQKAGTFDKEKFITAMEGMVLDTSCGRETRGSYL